MSIVFDTQNRLEKINTVGQYNLLIKHLYQDVLEDFRLFLMNEQYEHDYILNDSKVFDQLVRLNANLRNEFATTNFDFSNKYLCKELDEELIFRNIMSFFGSVAYYENKYYKNPWKMWYHILNKLPVGPHACPFYLNENLDNTCRSCNCNSISNVCTHPIGKDLNMSFWNKELKELVGLVYEEAYK